MSDGYDEAIVSSLRVFHSLFPIYDFARDWRDIDLSSRDVMETVKPYAPHRAITAITAITAIKDEYEFALRPIVTPRNRAHAMDE